MKKEINYSICLLKVSAMLLIINSHSDALFPSKFSFLATGGAIGNELFFLISGYLFFAKKDIFGQIINRIKRLYIPTYLITIVLMTFSMIPLERLRFVHLFIWPTEFWFVSSLLVFTIIMSCVGRTDIFKDRIKYYTFSLAVIIIDVLVYVFFVTEKTAWIVEDFRLPGEIPFKIIYSFLAFSLGYYMKQSDFFNTQHEMKTKVVNLALSVLLFLGLKVLLNKGIIPMQLQIISQPVTIYVVYWTFVFIMESASLRDWLKKHSGLSEMIFRGSSLTLEAYLLQFVIIDVVSKIRAFFPLNYLISTMMIVILAVVFHNVLEVLYSAMDRLSFSKRKI